MAALILASPSIWSGIQLDDYFQRAAVLGFPGPVAGAATAHGMFGFVDGDVARTRRFKDLGVVPWWASDSMRAAFWRPVSEMTHRLDYALWPDTPALMHLQSLLWLAAAVLVVTALFRSLLGPGLVSGLAAWLWAIDDAHGMAVGWIANRNAVVAVFFGLLTLYFHDRWRRRSWSPGAVFGAATFVVALLSGEAAVATLAYLFAYAVFLEKARPVTRVATLAPYASILVVWRIAYQMQGYGASGSGLYIDPVRNPVRFATAAALRLPVLLEGLLGAIPSDIDLVLPFRLHVAFVIVSVGLVVGFALVTRRAWQTSPTAKFFALGALLSLLPICATMPSDRLLLFAGIGAMGFVAQFIVSVFDNGPSMRAPRAAAIVLLGLHAVLAPMLLPVRSLSVALVSPVLSVCIDQAPDDAALAAQSMVFLNAVEFCGAYLPLRRAFEGRTNPLRTRTLVNATTPFLLRREDDKTLVLDRDIGFFSKPAEQGFLDVEHPWSVGQRIDWSGVSVEIRALTSDGFPRELAFRFPVPLEDPSLRWLELRSHQAIGWVPLPVAAPAIVVGPTVTF